LKYVTYREKVDCIAFGTLAGVVGVISRWT